MKYGPLLFLGILCCMAASSLTFVLVPEIQSGKMEQTNSIPDSLVYPSQPVGLAHQGAEVYRANNCAACHTRQVRPVNLGPDLSRGWGIRQSVGRDYLFDQPVMLGQQRVGPDLANAGLRMDARTILLHLYNPRATVPDSVMPPYRFLFEKRKAGRGGSSPDAIMKDGDYEIIPRKEATSLAAFLMSQRQDLYLFEAPPPPSKAKPAAAAGTNAPSAAATNAPAVATNSPAK